MREEFEKLSEIEKVIKKYDGYRVGNKYSTYDTSYTAWLNGAWYAYQEQQRKISAVLRFLSGFDSIDIENSVNLRDCVNEVQELLK